MKSILQCLAEWASSGKPSSSEPDWHNGHGTQADHQVPAESDNLWRSDSADLDNWANHDSSGQDFSSGSFND